MNKTLSRRKSQAVISTYQLQRNPSKISIQKPKNNQIKNTQKFIERDNNGHKQQCKRTPQFQRNLQNKFKKEGQNQNINTINLQCETIHNFQIKRASSKSNIHTKNITKQKEKQKKSSSLIRSKSHGRIIADGIQFKRKSLSPFASQHNTNFISVQSQIRRSNQTAENQKTNKKSIFNYKSEQIKHINQPLKKKKSSGNKKCTKSQGKSIGDYKKKIKMGQVNQKPYQNQKQTKKKSIVGITHNLPKQILKQIEAKGKTSQLYGIAYSKTQNVGSKISTIRNKKQERNFNRNVEAIKKTGPTCKSKTKLIKNQQSYKQKQYSEISFEQFVANTSHGNQRIQRIKKIKTDFDIEEQHFNSHQQLKQQAQLYKKLRSNMQNRRVHNPDVFQQPSSSFSSSSFHKEVFNPNQLVRIDKKWICDKILNKNQTIQKSEDCVEEGSIQPVTFTNQNSCLSQFASDHIFKVGLSNEIVLNKDDSQLKQQQNSLITIKDFNNQGQPLQNVKYETKLSLRQYQQESFLIEQNKNVKSDKKQNQSFADLLQQILQEKTLDQAIKYKIKKALQKEQINSPKLIKQVLLERKIQQSPNMIIKQDFKKEQCNKQKSVQEKQQQSTVKQIFKEVNKRISLQIQIVKAQCDQSPIKTVQNVNEEDWLAKSQKKKEYVQKKVEAQINSQKFFNSPLLDHTDFKQYISPKNRNRQFQSPKHFSSPRQFKQRNQRSCSPLNINKQFFFFKEQGSLEKLKNESEKDLKVTQGFICQSPKRSSKVQDYLNTAQQQLKQSLAQHQTSSQKMSNIKLDPRFPQINVTSQFIENFIVLIFRYLKSSCSINQIDDHDYIEYPLIFNFLEKLNNLRYYQSNLNTHLISQLIRDKNSQCQLLDRAVQQFMLKSSQFPDSIFPLQILSSLSQNQEVINLLKKEGFGLFLQELSPRKRQQRIQNSFLSLVLDAISEATYRQFFKYQAYFSKIQGSINIQKLSECLVIKNSGNSDSSPSHLQVPKQASDLFVKIFLLVIPVIKDWSQRLAGTTYQEYWNDVQLKNQIEYLNKKAYDKMGIEHNQDINQHIQTRKMSHLMLSLVAQQIYQQQIEQITRYLLKITY